VYCRCSPAKVYGCANLTAEEVVTQQKDYPELASLGRNQKCEFIYEPLSWNKPSLGTTLCVALTLFLVIGPICWISSFILGGKLKAVPRRTNFMDAGLWRIAYGSSNFESVSPEWFMRYRFACVALTSYIITLSLLRQVVVVQWFIFMSHWCLLVQLVYFVLLSLAAKYAVQGWPSEEQSGEQSVGQTSAQATVQQ